MTEQDRPIEAAPQPAGLAGLPLLHRRDLLLRAALESILIVLSVFLALFLDEWRAEREIEKRVETARAYLVREVRSNQRALLSDGGLPYHQRMRQLLTDASGEPGPRQQAAVARMRGGAFTGVHPFRAQNVAWNTFRTAEVTTRLPPDELFLLAQIYDAQESLKAVSESFYAGMMQPSAEGGSEAFERSQMDVIRTYFSDAIPAEETLTKLYARALRTLEQPEKP